MGFAINLNRTKHSPVFPPPPFRPIFRELREKGSGRQPDIALDREIIKRYRIIEAARANLKKGTVKILAEELYLEKKVHSEQAGRRRIERLMQDAEERGMSKFPSLINEFETQEQIRLRRKRLRIRRY